jgi:dephospho-CoA kinase
MDTIRDLGLPVQVIELKCSDRARLKRCKSKYETLEELKRADEVDKNLGIQEVLGTADISLSTNGSLKKTRAELVNIVETFVNLD